MVLDAAEDMSNDFDEVDYNGDTGIPTLNRHLAHRDEFVESRIASKEDILQQRQEMLEEEKMAWDNGQNGGDEDNEDEEDEEMEEEQYDYSTAFFQ